MIKLNFEIEINAKPNKIWQVLWQDEFYRKWANVFCEGTYAISNWKERDSVHFLSPSGDGMYSIIDKKIENQIMSFKHIGNIKNYIELPLDEETRLWTNCKEVYELNTFENCTLLLVSLETLEVYENFFKDNFMKALKIIKNESENYQ